MIAAAWYTVSSKLWFVLSPALVIALIVTAYTPPVPGPGVPANEAVPLPLSVRVTPVGRVVAVEMAGTGHPEVVVMS